MMHGHTQIKFKSNLLYIRNIPYRAVNTLHHIYKNQSFNDSIIIIIIIIIISNSIKVNL
jgi:hypothetical protein